MLDYYKEYSIRISQYFSKSYERFGENIKVELDLSSYATKVDLKGATGIDTSALASKTHLDVLEDKVDNLNRDNIKISCWPE